MGKAENVHAEADALSGRRKRIAEAQRARWAKLKRAA